MKSIFTKLVATAALSTLAYTVSAQKPLLTVSNSAFFKNIPATTVHKTPKKEQTNDSVTTSNVVTIIVFKCSEQLVENTQKEEKYPQQRSASTQQSKN